MPCIACCSHPSASPCRRACSCGRCPPGYDYLEPANARKGCYKLCDPPRAATEVVIPWLLNRRFMVSWVVSGGAGQRAGRPGGANGASMMPTACQRRTSPDAWPLARCAAPLPQMCCLACPEGSTVATPANRCLPAGSTQTIPRDCILRPFSPVQVQTFAPYARSTAPPGCSAGARRLFPRMAVGWIVVRWGALGLPPWTPFLRPHQSRAPCRDLCVQASPSPWAAPAAATPARQAPPTSCLAAASCAWAARAPAPTPGCRSGTA